MKRKKNFWERLPDWMPKFLDELRSKKNYFDWDEHRDIEGRILAIINYIAPNYFEEKEQKPTWSEEDEKMLHIILTDINYAQKNYSTSKLTPYDKKVSWLKSLRSSWQPSEEDRKELIQVKVKPIVGYHKSCGFVATKVELEGCGVVCTGKGNPDTNYSAPHGAGRLMSRAAAKSKISLKDFEKSMKGIYSTSICRETLDESPMAYKPMEEIIKNLEPCAVVECVLKPKINIKATKI